MLTVHHICRCFVVHVNHVESRIPISQSRVGNFICRNKEGSVKDTRKAFYIADPALCHSDVALIEQLDGNNTVFGKYVFRSRKQTVF